MEPTEVKDNSTIFNFKIERNKNLQRRRLKCFKRHLSTWKDRRLCFKSVCMCLCLCIRVTL